MAKKIEPDFSGEAGPALHSARWRFGPFELDEASRELRRGGIVMTIEAKPLNMLMLFLRNPGELVTKDELLDKLWTGRIVGEAVIGNCVTRLRQVLGEDTSGWLRSVHGFGYRFDGPVQLVEEARATVSAAPKLDFQPGDQPPLRPNWQLLRRLGLSGDSWLAEHTKTRARRVFKFTREAAGLSALKREVTVYRLLRESSGEKIFHVDLLDWNFDAPPWFVETEYCPGGSLQEWFEAQGGVGKVPLATRLDLIAQIADALAEVHAVGVLHKDLKPANVFVMIEADGRPSIRLADFGASRLLDPARLAALEITRLGFTQVIDNNGSDNSGTPLYFAPELLAGHPATVKADIYALGVMLYQFVIGNLRRQLTPGWEAEVDDEILRSDIAAAAEGNPERRLGDASELARKLRRLEARRVAQGAERAAAERAERAARALERMKARRVGVMAAFAALAVGFAASSTLYLEARKSRAHAEQESARASDAARKAEAEARRAEAVSAFLTRDLFAPVTDGNVPVKNMTVAELLKAGANSVGKRFEHDPDTAADLNAALGLSFSALEMSAEAEERLEAAMAVHAASRGSADLSVVNDAAALATLKFAMGRDDAHLASYETLAAEAARLHGPLDDAVLHLRTELAASRLYRGQLQIAARAFQSILDDQLKVRPDDDRAIASTCRGLSRALALYGDYPGAEAVVNRGLESAIRSYGPAHESVGDLHTIKGLVAVETGHYERAETEYRAALQIAETWGHASSGPRISALYGLARTSLLHHRYGEAIDRARAALRDIGSVSSDFDQSALVRLILGEAFAAQGNHALAKQHLELAFKISAKNYGVNHVCTRRIRLALARNAAATGDIAALTKYLDESPMLQFKDVAADHSLNRELAGLRSRLTTDASQLAVNNGVERLAVKARK